MKTFALVLTSATLAATAFAAPDGGTAPAPAPAQPNPAMVEDLVAYTEWVLDVRLTAAQRAEAQEAVDKALASKNPRELALVQEAIKGKADLANFSESEVRTLRPSVEDEYLKSLRRRNRDLVVAKWVVSVADARKPLVPGTPPLTRQSADAFAELMAFVVSQTAGQPVAADKTFRDAFAKALAADYKGYSDEQKAAVADLPKDWATLRTGFAAFPDDKKEKLKKEWSEALAPLLGDPKAAAKVTGDAKPLRDAAKALSAKVTGWL